jgi:uncharacterized protein DUF4936
VSRGRELFVWYRVADDRAEEARIELEAMQRRLEATHPALRARLLVRADNGGLQTWMETYASGEDDAGIDEAMQKRIEAAAAPLVRWLDGPRHAETFDLADRS